MFVATLFARLDAGAVTVNTSGEPRSFRAAAWALQRIEPEIPITARPGTLAENPTRNEAPEAYDDTFLRSNTQFAPQFPFELGIEATFKGHRSLVRGDAAITARQPSQASQRSESAASE